MLGLAAGAVPACCDGPPNANVEVGAALTLAGWLAPKEKGREGAALAAGAAAEPAAAADCPKEKGAGEAAAAVDVAAAGAAEVCCGCG